jgi:UPF0716 protein FxsA
MMVKWFLFGLVVLLVAEVAAFLAVAALIGLPQAFLLLVGTSLVGVAVLRHPGRARINRLHEAVAKNGIPGLEAGGDAFLTVAAGVLLLIPGLITDAAGLLLLLPPVRRWIGGRFQRSMQTKSSAARGVVDLEPDQWNQLPDRQIDDRPPPTNRP